MMTQTNSEYFFDISSVIGSRSEKWLVTGGAGFIGSNIVEALLGANQFVTVLDNLATGYESNLTEAVRLSGAGSDKRLNFIRGDIRSLSDCESAFADGVDYVLHQAALGSVPRSIADPQTSHAVNVDGFLNMLETSRKFGVKRFVYASSSSVYGDSPSLPKIEDVIGAPLSPYAGTKRINEIYADIWSKTYEMQTLGLRYFNVFGPRQDPNGAYAAVIPKWIAGLLAGVNPVVNGDGLTSRDFCYIKNTVQANIRAALANDIGQTASVLNVACAGRTTLNDLLSTIRKILRNHGVDTSALETEYRPFRAGDVQHSHANISKAMRAIQYIPTHDLEQGLIEAMPWYMTKQFEGR